MKDLFDFADGQNARKNRRAHSRTPKVEHVDPMTLWRSLPPDAADHIGSLAIALSLATAGTNARDGIDQIYERFEAVLRESCQQLDDFLMLHFPHAYISGNGRFFPKLPVLTALMARVAA